MITTSAPSTFDLISELIIASTELADTGNYSCTASSEVGSDTKSFTVFITGEGCI